VSDPRETPTANPLLVLRAFSALRRSVALYPPGHVVIDQVLGELQSAVEQALDATETLRIQIIAGNAHVDGYPYRVESAANAGVLEELSRLGVECLHIDRGVSASELAGVAQLLNELGDRKAESVSIGELLIERGVERVKITKLLPVGEQRERLFSWPDAPKGIDDPEYTGVLSSARQAIGPVFAGESLEAGAVRSLVEGLADQILDRRGALAAILGVKRYENHTYCHSVNVAALAVFLGRRIELDETTLSALAEGALLHDVGKRSIPREIISKPGKLTEHEWRIVKRHPVVGAELLAPISGLGAMTPTLALEHHRDFAGGGYPDLGDEKPTPLSQLLSVVDVYEALTGARSYRPPLPPDEACLMLAKMSGDKLNPNLVRAFISLITFFPIGTAVRTSQGEVGIVIETCEDEPLHPTIVVVEREGAAVAPGYTVNTADRDERGGYLRHILETLPDSDAALEVDAFAQAG
jgi:putative nucleotidyltransferase with HDIG domain